jgi:haloalkane dehalogenase
MRPNWIPSDLYPFEDRWLDLDGHRVHYVDEGHGPTLLLLHGNPTWSFLYRNIIQELRGQFRCIAVDYPGFGLSTAAPGYGFTPREHSVVLEKLVVALELEDVTLMVQDWGGPIGLGLASRLPERFVGFVIANTWAWPADAKATRFSNLMGGPIGRFAIRHFNAFVNVLIPAGTARKLPKEVMRAYRGPFRTRSARMATAIFPREIVASRAYLAEVEAGLSRIASKPALILWGTKDPAFQAYHRQRFELTFTRHRSVLLEGARHYIQEDAPERIAEEIRHFVPALSRSEALSSSHQDILREQPPVQATIVR